MSSRRAEVMHGTGLGRKLEGTGAASPSLRGPPPRPDPTGATMPEVSGRQQTRLDPEAAWTVLTDAPLKGLGLAREAGTILAWDERDRVYLFDLHGGHRSATQVPDHVVAGAISDDGSLVALLGRGARLWLHGADLEVIADRQGPPEASALAVDPHGRYVAVASRLGL